MEPTRIMAILSGQERSLAATLLRGLLTAAEPLYAVAIALRNAAFDLGLRRGASLPGRVISVGNLTTGGTGKTPLVIELALLLQARGRRVAVLLRGYHAAAAGSDEALLLEQELGPGVAVAACPSRVAGAKMALERQPESDVFLLDDAFQHRQVRRDVDLVLIDATNPWGFGHLLPRGLMREPRRALRRASLAIITRCELATADELALLEKQIAAAAPGLAVARAQSGWTGFRDRSGAVVDLAALAQKKVVGLCAIGNPEAFARELKRHCPQMLAVHALPDHFDLAQLPAATLAALEQQQPEALVVTEKDWMKLAAGTKAGLGPSGLGTRPIYRAVMRVEIIAGREKLEALLASAVQAPQAAP